MVAEARGLELTGPVSGQSETRPQPHMSGFRRWRHSGAVQRVL